MPKNSLWVSYTINTQPLFSINQITASFPLDYWVPFHNANELPSSQQLSLEYKRTFNFSLKIQAETYYKKSKNLSIVYNIDDFILDEDGYDLATGAFIFDTPHNLNEKKLKKGSRIWQLSLLNATFHRNPYMIYYDSYYDDSQGYKAFQLIPILPSFSYTRKF